MNETYQTIKKQFKLKTVRLYICNSTLQYKLKYIGGNEWDFLIKEKKSYLATLKPKMYKLCASILLFKILPEN